MIEKIEDIYPLTIIKIRFSGRIVILNADVDAGEGDDRLDMSWANYIQGVENIQIQLEEWMEEYVSPCFYGIGNNLTEAFEDYKNKLTK